jgi:hypothetical protein
MDLRLRLKAGAGVDGAAGAGVGCAARAGVGLYWLFWLQNPPFPLMAALHCSRVANPQFIPPPPLPYCAHHG